MKYIKKDSSNQPNSLREKQAIPGATYDDCNKDDIRIAFLKEQGNICAYCMRRIVNKRDGRGKFLTQIGHYIAQSTDEDLRKNFMKSSASITKSYLLQELKKWEQRDGEGSYNEFCQVAIYYLRKKLQRLP